MSASADQTLKVWEPASGCELRTLTGHTGVVFGVAIGGDGRLAASASDDQTLRVWNVEMGAIVATFTCDGAALCCAFSDALNLIIAIDAGGHLHFLRLEEGKK